MEITPDDAPIIFLLLMFFWNNWSLGRLSRRLGQSHLPWHVHLDRAAMEQYDTLLKKHQEELYGFARKQFS
jgi:hypothetical protein